MALEVDGAQHFSVMSPYLETGETQARNALLESRGYRVVSVPFYEWDELKTMKEQTLYLDKKLSMR